MYQKMLYAYRNDNLNLLHLITNIVFCPLEKQFVVEFFFELSSMPVVRSAHSVESPAGRFYEYELFVTKALFFIT